MRIVIVVNLFLPKWLGGTEIATYNTAKLLSERGHDVIVVTNHDKGLPKKDRMNGFNVYRISTIGDNLISVFYFWFKLLILIKRLKPTLVHFQGVNTATPGIISRKLFKIPFVVYGRGSDVYQSWKFKTIISKHVLKNADGVISLTEYMKNEFKKITPCNVTVIPNGITLDRFKGEKKQLREKLAFSADETVVIFLSRLNKVKGPKYLIEAAEIIQKQKIKYKVLIVGDGDEKCKLEALTKTKGLCENIFFIGEVPNKEVVEYLVLSDIFVLPTLSEGFGIVYIEAMASGLPIVTTKIMGVNELVEDGKNGFLVDTKNPEQIAEKIKVLISDKKLTEEISMANKKKATKYSWDRIVSKIEKVYKQSI